MEVVRRDPDKGYVDSVLWLPKSRVNERSIRSALTYEFVERKEQMTLELWRESEHHMLVPRCFIDVREVDYDIIDCRPASYPQAVLRSKIVLDVKNPKRTVQKQAVRALLNANGGILQLACGLGKTCVALHTIAKLHTPAIIHIDNMHLLGQWRKEILLHLDIDEDEIGFIGDGVFDWKKPIVLATYQSIANKAHSVSEEFRRWFGQAWWDEGHHAGAPTYCRSADLYYGKRFLLTATPYRDDGQHVIYDMHIGPVLYKDLTQDLVPEIIFKWTGFTADEKDPEVFEQIGTTAGELHFAKLSAYMGSQPDRLQYIVDFVRGLVNTGRKVLVLSPSVAELSNLLCTWNGQDVLFNDIPVPTNAELGFEDDIVPRTTTLVRAQWMAGMLKKYFCPHARPSQIEIDLVSNELEGEFLAAAIHNEMEKRRKKFVNELSEQPGNAGLMIRKVNEATRSTVIADKEAIFVVHKYGKEGLDAADIDTVVACEPMSKKNATQQFMGRALRIKPGKKVPQIYVLVDKVGLLIGMSLKMQKVLRNWPCDEGGPFKYMKQGYPEKKMSISKVQALARMCQCKQK